MENPVVALEKVLSREKELYESICSLESTKKEAIITRDGRTLERLSIDQERILVEVQQLEKRRSRLIDEYSYKCRLNDLGRDITLSDIVASMDEDSSLHLMRIGMDLKDALVRLKNLQELNGNLLKDTMEFYQILLSGLKNGISEEAGYGRDGKEEGRIAGSILFNKTV